jgi:hypothetical protein
MKPALQFSNALSLAAAALAYAREGTPTPSPQAKLGTTLAGVGAAVPISCVNVILAGAALANDFGAFNSWLK